MWMLCCVCCGFVLMWLCVINCVGVGDGGVFMWVCIYCDWGVIVVYLSVCECY